MKLSTRGRYGTLLMIELAKNYGKGPTSMSVVSKNRNISVKYLEQLIIPLKKGNLIKSLRGAQRRAYAHQVAKVNHVVGYSPVARIQIFTCRLLL